jgi:uncharacterized protein YegP (UPF0339 family)
MYFEIVTAAGGYRANINGDNHELVFQTETDNSKAGAQNTIDMVKKGRGRRGRAGPDLAAGPGSRRGPAPVEPGDPGARGARYVRRLPGGSRPGPAGSDDPERIWLPD